MIPIVHVVKVHIIGKATFWCFVTYHQNVYSVFYMYIWCSDFAELSL